MSMDKLGAANLALENLEKFEAITENTRRGERCQVPF